MMTYNNQRYVTMVHDNPAMDDFIRAATPTHLMEESLAQLVWLGGNHLHFIGPPLRIIALLLVVPLALIAGIILLPHPEPGRRDLQLLLLLSIVGTAWAFATSWLAGHTFGMRYYYAMFSAPYVIVLIGIGAARWLRGSTRQRIAGGVLIAAILAIAGASLQFSWLHGYHGNDARETVTPAAKEIDRIVSSSGDQALRLEHRSARAALMMNLHLGDVCAAVPQSVDTNLQVATRLVGTNAGSPLFELKE
jgi:hypothetical protein